MKRCGAILFSATLLLSACSIKQDVTPVAEQMEGNEICIVNNPAVMRPEFLQVMKQAMTERGYKPLVYEKGAPSLDTCKYNLIYTANWKWDLAMYLSYVKIDLLHKNQAVGTALYDASNGPMSLKKFIKGEKKVRELIAQLLPHFTPGQPMPTESKQ